VRRLVAIGARCAAVVIIEIAVTQNTLDRVGRRFDLPDRHPVGEVKLPKREFDRLKLGMVLDPLAYQARAYPGPSTTQRLSWGAVSWLTWGSQVIPPTHDRC
jgi:hypothetical protein